MAQSERIPSLQPGETSVSFELVETTLGELEGQLPHGFLTADGSRREVVFERATVALAKKRGELKQDQGLVKKTGQLFAHWLGMSISRLGQHDLAGERNMKQRALKVAELTFADFLFLMIAYHRAAKPGGYAMKGLSCGICGIDWPEVNVKFDTLKVSALPPDASLANPPLVRVGLHHGFEYPKGETVRTVLLKPPSFMTSVWPLTAQEWDNTVALGAALIEASVVQVDTVDIGKFMKLPPGIIDTWMEEDLNLCNEALGRITPTLDLRLDVQCPSCGELNEALVDWRSPGFMQAFLK